MSRSSAAKILYRGVVALFAAALSAVAAQAEAQNLPVPKIVIYPGEVITEQMLVDRAFNASWAARMPVHKNHSDLIGKTARRTLPTGQPIAVNATREAEAVTQGKTYRIEFRESGLVISGTAVAMTAGAVGDLVSLRNPDSGMVVRGIVGADGVIRMGTP